MAKVLVIDDNPSVGIALEVLLSLRDIDTVVVHGPQEGLERMAVGDIGLVIQDMNFDADTTSGVQGEALFEEIRNRHPEMPIVLLTAWTRLEAAVRLVKSGASDYLQKPWDDAKLLTTVGNLLELGEKRRSLRRQKDRASRRRKALQDDFDLRGLVFADPKMEQTLGIACQLARSTLPVLITGPNGCGKEKLAELIHANSPVKNGPWVPVNCGALPEKLLEAELFGASAGAYTGANEDRVGRFGAAQGGTIFLDEIGTLSPEGQVKLLRILESGTYTRLGEHQERQANVRVVSATNADLEQMIADGVFRQDLWYRINTLELKVPSLADRPEDVEVLAEHFLKGRKALSSCALAALESYAWPGNVRELRNVIERAALLATGASIEAEDLSILKTRPKAQGDHTRRNIMAAIERNNGVIAKAAEELGLSRQSLYRRMEKLGLKRTSR